MSLILAEDECPTICTLEYRPFCAGPPGSTKEQWEKFRNPCALDAHNCLNKTSKNSFNNIRMTISSPKHFSSSFFGIDWVQQKTDEC